MHTHARHLQPGDKITHPISGKTEMIRSTTHDRRSVTLTFYGTTQPFVVSKTTTIDKETDSE